MGDAGESLVTFRKFLKNHRVHDSIVAYMTKPEPDGPGMEAVSDFASFFTDATFEEGCAVKLAAHTDCKDNDNAIGRLRTAWRMAQAELTKAVTEVQAGKAASSDWDAPLDETEEKKRKTDCDRAYDNLQYDAESQPASTLVGRCYREFTNDKREKSLESLKRMRSEAEFRNQVTNKKQSLLNGEGVELTYTDSVPRFPDIDFVSLLQVTGAMRLMTNMWTMTGVNEVDSKTDFDQATHQYKKVRQCHMSQATSYHDFFFRKAMEHPGPPTRPSPGWWTETARAGRRPASCSSRAGHGGRRCCTHEMSCARSSGPVERRASRKGRSQCSESLMTTWSWAVNQRPGP